MELLNTVGILDLIFIVILAISILLGLMRGAIREILSLIGLSASIYLAFKFSDLISENYVSQVFEDSRISYIVTFILIIVCTLFAVTLVNLFFSQLLKASGLSFLDRFLGMVFGLLRGTAICSIFVLIIGFVPGIASKSWWQESSLAPIFKNVTKASFKYLPDEVASYFDSAKENVESASDVLNLPKSSSPNDTTTETNDTANQILQSIGESGAESEQDNTTNTQPQIILESAAE